MNPLINDITSMPKHKRFNKQHFKDDDFISDIKTSDINRVEILVSDHLKNLNLYLNAPITEKYFYLNKIRIIWNELKILGSTSEAHRRTLNTVFKLGLIRSVGIPR